MNITHEHRPTGLYVRVLEDDDVVAELECEDGGTFIAPSGEIAQLSDSNAVQDDDNGVD